VFISVVGLVSLSLWPQSRDSAGAILAELPTLSGGESRSPAPAPPESSVPSSPATPVGAAAGTAGVGAKGATGKGGKADESGNPGKGRTQTTAPPPAASTPESSTIPERGAPRPVESPARPVKESRSREGRSTQGYEGATRKGPSNGHASQSKHTNSKTKPKHSSGGQGRGGHGNGHSEGSKANGH
jgi:hypothetical protein